MEARAARGVPSESTRHDIRPASYKAAVLAKKKKVRAMKKGGLALERDDMEMKGN